MPRTLFLLSILFSVNVVIASWEEVAKQGTQARLTGDYDQAKLIERHLLEEAQYPIGHIFALNTIITHLTWDETQKQYDKAIIHHTREVMRWCEPRLDTEGFIAIANHYCGQAGFALSFYYGLKGSYLQAGQHGSRAIRRLEAALIADPTLTDAKLHLGVAYFIADNLPSFIKMFSRFLWFIPTGNSEKSLPYLIDVMTDGDEFPDVARYMYSTLMLMDDSTRPLAISELTYLANRYPKNSRFQLRLISALLMQKNHAAALAQAKSYLKHKPTESDLTLTLVWMVRANISLGSLPDAERLLDNIKPSAYESLPSWSLSWHLLSLAQLNDLRGQRDPAISTYGKILSMAESDYVDGIIVEAAKSGLVTPYKLK